MARRNSQNAISLFPFLAVLVCTMGALILLLLVTTRRIRKEHILGSRTNESIVTAATGNDWTDSGKSGDVPSWAATDTPIQTGVATGSLVIPPEQTAGVTAATDHESSITLMPPTTPDRDPPDDDARLQGTRQAKLEGVQRQLADESARHHDLLQQIVAAKAELQDSTFGSDDYTDQLSDLMALRRQETELREELERKNQSLSQLQAELESHSKTAEAGEKLLRARESALVSLRQIAREKAESTSAGTDQTIIEFTNASGTQRSPVVINVTDSGFEFLPANVKIRSADMQGFPANDNPLLAGILAIHSSRNATSISSRPYVLLLIRPGGSRFFYAAQRTLTDAGIHFGYELLEKSRKIAAGQRSADETHTLRSAIVASLARRRELYSGLMAQVRTPRPETARQPQRRVRVLPDGRVAFPEESGGGMEGRFYAGGEAPPEKPDVLGEWPGPVAGNDTESGNNTVPQTDSFSEQLPGAEQSFPSNDDAIFPPLMTNAENTEHQSSDQPEIIPGVSSRPDEEKAPAWDAVAGLSESAAKSHATEPAHLKADQRFPHRDSISGNMGVGGHRELSKPNPTNPFSTPPRTAGVTHDLETTEPAGPVIFDPAWPANTSSSERGTAQPGLRNTDRTRPEPSGWSDLSTAHSDPTTRTAGTAPDSVFGPSAASASGSPGSNSPGVGGAVPSSDSQSFLDRFMREVEERNEPPKPDPYLLKLLRNAQQRKDAATTHTQAQSAHVQQQTVPSRGRNPPGSQKEGSSLPAFGTTQKFSADLNDGGHGITIVLQEDQLTIGSFETIDITGRKDEQILATVLEGLNAELKLLNKSGITDAVPVIEFVVAPGLEPVQQMLTKELAGVEVATRSVRRLRSAAGTEPSGGRKMDSPADSFEQQEPAEPLELPRTSRTRRGRSI